MVVENLPPEVVFAFLTVVVGTLTGRLELHPHDATGVADVVDVAPVRDPQRGLEGDVLPFFTGSGEALKVLPKVVRRFR
jgi:hypothetical protein